MEQLEKLEVKIDQLSAQVQRLNFHLFNDEGAGMMGAIKRVENNEKRLEKIETDAKIRTARAAVWGSIGGGVLLIAKELIGLIKHA